MKPRLPCSQPPGPSSLLLKITPPQQNSAETSNHQIKLPLNRAMHLFQLSTDSIHRRQLAIKIRTTHTINQSSQREYKYVDTKSTRQIKFEKQKHTNKKCAMRENTVRRIKSTAGLGSKKIGLQPAPIQRIYGGSSSLTRIHTHTLRGVGVCLICPKREAGKENLPNFRTYHRCMHSGLFTANTSGLCLPASRSTPP